MAAKVGGEGQQAAYKKLNADPPSGWYTGPPWYGERPNVWRTPILEASRGPAAWADIEHVVRTSSCRLIALGRHFTALELTRLGRCGASS
jgi:hypothetical protein